MGFRDWKVGSKITAGYLVILAALLTAAGYLIVSMRTLAALQKEEFQRTQDLDDILQAEMEVTRLYGVWGDAVINRHPEDSRRALATLESHASDLYSRLDADARDAEQKRMAAGIRASYDRYLATVASGLTLVERLAEAMAAGADTSQLETQIRAHNVTIDELRDETIGGFDAFAAVHREAALEGEIEFEETIDDAIKMAIALTIAGALIAVVVGIGTARSITTPLAGVVTLLKRIAGGDLTDTVAVDRKDEVGDLLAAAADMSRALRSLIAETKAGASTLATATSQINASSRRNVEASQSQLSAVQETTTSATELQETARVAGERAREIQMTLATTSESGGAIKDQLGDATELLARAREELHSIVGSVQDLSARNQQIGEIIESVAEVADQTQLLAVNASIEAAKAGDVGRGFGVVATEMKTLAEQSKKSAQRIRAIVGEVQRATAGTVQLVETGQSRLQEALDPVTAILPKVGQLTVQAEESGQSGRQIVAIVAQQGAGIEQISQAMRAIQGGVQEGLAQTQQVERAAESLNALAAKLRDTVATYRV
jgi:methyl-accepting chemotaxis protein